MKIKEVLERKNFIVTSEVQAPIGEDTADLVAGIKRVRGRLDGISVSEVEVDGLVGDSVKVCEALKTNRFNLD